MSADPGKSKRAFSTFDEIDRTIRPPTDITLRNIVCHCHFTEDTTPLPGPLLDRMHAIAEREAVLHRPLGRHPLPAILENLALILHKRGAGAARVRDELAALQAG